MTTLSLVQEFFDKSQPIAVAGVSRNPKQFGRMAYEHLKAEGFNVIPVNPNMQDVNGSKCYGSIGEVPADVKRLLVLVNRGQTNALVSEAMNTNIDRIWIQQTSETPEAIAKCNEKGVKLVTNECVFMFTNPRGVHKFHRFLKSIFGSLPR